MFNFNNVLSNFYNIWLKSDPQFQQHILKLENNNFQIYIINLDIGLFFKPVGNRLHLKLSKNKIISDLSIALDSTQLLQILLSDNPETIMQDQDIHINGSPKKLQAYVCFF